MKYFLDTEFRENGKTIELISIGIVAGDGREYYAINEEMPLDEIMCDPWMVANVVPHLPILGSQEDAYYFANDPMLKASDLIRQEIIEFVKGDDIEFWAYYGDYDWVATCRLFGRMIDLPKGWPMLCYDLRQWLDHNNMKHIRQPDDAPHHALYDARWVAYTHKINS